MKIAIYSRKSKFTGKGESTQNQIEMCKEYANKHFDVKDIFIYEDEGFSGGTIDRPKYKQMITEAKKKKFDVLMCYRLDRISRNIADFSDTIETLQDHDIAFISIREQFDTSTPMGRAMMYITSVFAQLERETIAERIRDNMAQLARSGRWLGGRTPFGFKSKSVDYYDKDTNKRKMYQLCPIEEDLEMVKKIYKKYLDFSSLTQLESWTLEGNFKTRTGKNFDKSILRIILTNPVYAIADNLIYEYFESMNADIASPITQFDGKFGLMVYNKHDETKKKVKRKDESEWIIAVGMHQGIIPASDWIRVQNIIKENRKKAPRSGTGKYGLVTSLLRCKNCGSKMRISYKIVNGEVRHYYYKCMLKERSRGAHCNIKNINGKELDANIVNEIKSWGINTNEVYQELLNKKKNYNMLVKEQESEKTKLEAELSKYTHSINNLTIQLAENANSTASKYIIQQIENLDTKITELKKKLENIDEEKQSTLMEQLNFEITQNTIKNFANNFDQLRFDQKKKAIQQIIQEILWDGNRIEIARY